jgi:hypothetical protein
MPRPSVPSKQPTTSVRPLPCAGRSPLRPICRRPRSRRPFSTSASRFQIRSSRRSSLAAIDLNSERPRLRCGINQSASQELYFSIRESRRSFFMIQSSYPATDQRRSDHSAGANTAGSINVASSSSARELFTRLDTGKRASKSFAAGLSSSRCGRLRLISSVSSELRAWGIPDFNACRDRDPCLSIFGLHPIVDRYSIAVLPSTAGLCRIYCLVRCADPCLIVVRRPFAFHLPSCRSPQRFVESDYRNGAIRRSI